MTCRTNQFHLKKKRRNYHENICDRQPQGRGGQDHHRRGAGLYLGDQLQAARPVYRCRQPGQRHQHDAGLRPGSPRDRLAAALEYPLEHYLDIIWCTDYEGLDIIPAGEDLADYELSCLLGRQAPDFDRLRDLLAVVAEDAYYDTVVIDCPPYYSVSCLSAIAACDSIIIPAGIDAYSTTGMAGLVRQIDNIRQACPQIRVAGVLVTQWRRSSIGEDAVQTLREESPVPIFRTVIRRTDKVVESSWSREPVGALSPFSAASRDYRTWVAELLGREGVANNA